MEDSLVGTKWDLIVSKEQSNTCAYCLEEIVGKPATTLMTRGALYHSSCLGEAMLKAQERLRIEEGTV